LGTLKQLVPYTPEEKAIRVIMDAKLETDEDYVALARLIDEEVGGEAQVGENTANDP
jgi:hypothetical protein